MRVGAYTDDDSSRRSQRSSRAVGPGRHRAAELYSFALLLVAAFVQLIGWSGPELIGWSGPVNMIARGR
jgi:hypothetical protein